MLYIMVNDKLTSMLLFDCKYIIIYVYYSKQAMISRINCNYNFVFVSSSIMEQKFKIL